MITSGKATGRLDLLGGVADYSGALVLEIPTRVSTTVTVHPGADLTVGPVRLTRDDVADLAARPYPEIRKEAASWPKWTRYVIGVALALVRHRSIGIPTGTVTVTSEVPESVGVSSSAALEVATARALGATGSALEIASWCQEAENHVVGAPCGIMDQVAVTLGQPGAVLPILCRPASVEAAVALPGNIEIVGVPTGATHDISGHPYARARVAAFIGKRLAESAAGREWRWICDIPADAIDRLPDELDGSAFLDRWGATADLVTSVNPETTYPIRAATHFGAAEHLRTTTALAALRRGEIGALRQLMAESHADYRAIGLGHPDADDAVERSLAVPGVLGARTSGGGCGGTVVVAATTDAVARLGEVIR